MEQTLTTCPRGHEVAAAATRCLVCGTHVEPSAPNPFAEIHPPVSHRAPRSWRPARVAPLVGASLVILVVAGWIVGWRVLTPTPDADDVVVAGTPSAVTVAAPQAGTVPSATAPHTEPTPSPAVASAGPALADECRISGLGVTGACSPSGDLVTFAVCVPAGTTAVEVRTRKGADDAWKAPADAPVLQGPGACDSGQVEAQLVVKLKPGVTKDVRVSAQAADGEPVVREGTVSRPTAT